MFSIDQLKNSLRKILSYPLKGLVLLAGFDKNFPIYIPNPMNGRSRYLWKLKMLNPILGMDINLKENIASQIPIDICIPLSKKDLKKAEPVIVAARKHIKHPINKIYIIGDKAPEILDFCKKMDVSFIDELTVLGYGKTKIDYVVNGIDRSGWLFQQLLKLNSDRFVEMENYLILDADTEFVRPRIFLHKGKSILDQSEERHEPYHQTYYKLMGKQSISKLSFVTHYMIFNKLKVNELKRDIENIHQQSWDAAILQLSDYSSPSGFSEYELYGNYLLQTSPSGIKREYWFNSETTVYKGNTFTKSISSHVYNKL